MPCRTAEDSAGADSKRGDEKLPCNVIARGYCKASSAKTARKNTPDQASLEIYEHEGFDHIDVQRGPLTEWRQDVAGHT